MDFTFGISATNLNSELHDFIINSITNLNIPKYEILIAGQDIKQDPRYTVIDFDETEKGGWITRKKNLLCSHAKFENIVLLHDYIIFDYNWYKGFLKFGNEWSICMNIILNNDGTRFRDWCLNPYDVIPPKGHINSREFLLPYDVKNLSQKMYLSGAYWVAKTQFMLKNPLDESLCWGESEDIEWSSRVRNKTNFSMNTFSEVFLLKTKHNDFTLISEGNLRAINV